MYRMIFCALTVLLVTVFFPTNYIGEVLHKKILNNSLHSFNLTLKCCKGQFRLSLRNFNSQISRKRRKKSIAMGMAQQNGFALRTMGCVPDKTGRYNCCI